MKTNLKKNLKEIAISGITLVVIHVSDYLVKKSWIKIKSYQPSLLSSDHSQAKKLIFNTGGILVTGILHHYIRKKTRKLL